MHRLLRPIAAWLAPRGPHPALSRLARRLGFHLVRADYYSPIPDIDRLPASTWEVAAPMPGVDLRLDDALALLEGDLAAHIAEYAPPDGPPGTASGYHRDNFMYGQMDGEVLYAMVRHLKPRRIVEVGAGWSSLVISDAARVNADEGQAPQRRIFDPFPSSVLLRSQDRLDVQAMPAQDIARDHFDWLQAGDILFVDTTHTVRPAGDVLRLLLEVLPSLDPGVVVHVHDFFRPFEYPRFLLEMGLFWQEHHLLQAFLAFNDSFTVLLPNHALARAQPQRVHAVVPRLTSVAPGSALWLRREG